MTQGFDHKTRLGEMPVKGKDTGQVMLLHEHKRDAIRKTYTLVCVFAEQVDCRLLLLSSRAQDYQHPGLQQSLRLGRGKFVGGLPGQQSNRFIQDKIARVAPARLLSESVPIVHRPSMILIA